MNSDDQLSLLLMIRGVEITLVRGATSVPLCAVKGQTAGNMTRSDGVFVKFNTVDWLVIALDTGAIGQPKRGDVVQWNGKTYTVSHPDETKSEVDWHGPDELCYRIHSVEG